MSINEFFGAISNAIKPIKTIFSFYVLLYILPAGIMIYVLFEIKQHLFIENSENINLGAAIILVITLFFLLLWTIFYIIYFTSQRTKNPHLYQKGFLTDFSVKGNTDEQ